MNLGLERLAERRVLYAQRFIGARRGLPRGEPAALARAADPRKSSSPCRAPCRSRIRPRRRRLQDRLASPSTGPQTPLDAPLTEEEVLRVLARIARTGKPGDRLRAAELIGKQLGMFKEEGHRGPTLVEMVAQAERLRRERNALPPCDEEEGPIVEVTAAHRGVDGDDLA